MNAATTCEVAGCHRHQPRAIARRVEITEAGRALLRKWRDEEDARARREAEHALRGSR